MFLLELWTILEALIIKSFFYVCCKRANAGLAKRTPHECGVTQNKGYNKKE